MNGERESASPPSPSSSPPSPAAFPIVCELKSRFDGDWRIGDRVAALAASYEGPLALKSFDPDLIAWLRLKYPRLGPPGRPCPIGVVAEARYDDPSWAFLTPDQKRACETFDHRARSEPDFLSWNVNDLPHKTPFFQKEFYGLPVMTWTVRTASTARGRRANGPTRSCSRATGSRDCHAGGRGHPGRPGDERGDLARGVSRIGNTGQRCGSGFLPSPG